MHSMKLGTIATKTNSNVSIGYHEWVSNIKQTHTHKRTHAGFREKIATMAVIVSNRIEMANDESNKYFLSILYTN